MATQTKFRHEDLATVPRGWKVRTVTRKGHQVRIAFPPGARAKGSGKVVSILHPTSENTRCRQRNGLLEAAVTSAAATSGALLATKALQKNRGQGRGARGEGKAKNNSQLKPYELVFERDGRRSTWTRFAKPGTEKADAQGALKWEYPDGQWKLLAVRTLPRHRKNPSDAEQTYFDFHGRAPSEVIEMQEATVKAGTYAALGAMVGLWITPVEIERDPASWFPPTIEFAKADKVKLATDAGGQQLLLIGGDQELPLDYLESHGLDVDHRFVPLGDCYAIAYSTEKKFDSFETVDYCHAFGEETGERPQLVYDRQTKRLLLVGGAYKIAPYDAKLGASPGIVN